MKFKNQNLIRQIPSEILTVPHYCDFFDGFSSFAVYSFVDACLKN
jgi:hypothetical protein